MFRVLFYGATMAVGYVVGTEIGKVIVAEFNERYEAYKAK